MTLVWLAISWVGGILAAEVLGLPWSVLVFLGTGALFCLLAKWNSISFRMGGLSLLFLVLGAGRLLLAAPRFDDSALASYNDCGRVTLQGVIVGDPEEREGSTRLRVRAAWVKLPDGTGRAVNGLVLVTAPPYSELEYGDQVRVLGMLKTPPSFPDFSYRDYLARQGIYSLVNWGTVTRVRAGRTFSVLWWLFALRHWSAAAIASILPEPQAALLTGILVGVEAGIPRSLMDAFYTTGTTHIIAISGFNLTIVSGILAGLAERILGRKWVFWFAATGVALYTVLVGASAAVVRAAVMASVYLLGRHAGRKAFVPASLAAAAILMTAVNPYWLWDLGFLLSFAATLGLALYAVPLSALCQRFLERHVSADRAVEVLGLLNDAVLSTLAASVLTLPIIMCYSGRLSLVSLLTNCLILPVQPFVMTSGGISLLLTMLFRPLGVVAGWVAWVFLTYTIEVVRLCARLPWASVFVGMNATVAVVYYALLGGVTWWLGRDPARRQEMRDRLQTLLANRLQPGVLIAAAVVLLVLAGNAWHGRPDGRLHVMFLDVGQGDAIFVQTPSGRQILVDGGPSGSVLLSQLGRHMPFWDRTLDLVLLTHSDIDHVSGLVPVLERFRVDHVVFHEEGASSDVYERWLKDVAHERGVVSDVRAGQQIDLDQGVRMTVLYSGGKCMQADGNSNNCSVVTRLEYGQFSVLLPGDIEAPIEQSLVYDGAVQQSVVLKAAHHGSCTSTTQEFVDAVAPQVVVISVGADNEFGHPCDGVLERLAGLQVYRTDEDGTIEIVTDGSRYWIETER